MRVGIDAKWFFYGPPSGRVVVKNILSKLLELKGDHEYWIFLSKRDKDQQFPFKQDNVTLIYLENTMNLIGNTVLIPLRARKLNLDVILYQNFNGLFGKHKKLVFLQDVIFM